MPRRDLIRVAAALALAGFALMALVAWHGVPLPGDVWTTRQIQGIGQLDRNAAIVNRLADATWWVVAFAVVVILLGRHRGWPVLSSPSRSESLSAIAAAILLRLGDNLLKQLAESPRPTIAAGVRVEDVFGGYGYPSGHVYTDTLFYGLLAVLAPAWLPPAFIWPARVAALAIIALAGPARIVVGAHWPSDTLGGYLFGGAALCASAWFGRWVARRP